MGDRASDEKENGNLVYRELDTDRNEPAIEVAEIIAGLKGTESTDLSSIYNTVDHLLTHLFENPPSPDAQVEVGDKELDVLQTGFHHKHLPQLEEAGFIEWNRDTCEVEMGPDFGEIRPL